jgi:uncharacterized protein
MLDLDPRSSAILKAIFTRYAPLAEVWAFGSRVSGKAHGASDLDLLIRTPSALHQPITNMPDLQSAIEESSVPFLVDLHDWALLPAALRRGIEQAHCLFLSPGLCGFTHEPSPPEVQFEQ